MLDFFVQLYNLQSHKTRLLSPSRYLTRKLANIFLPKCLNKDTYATNTKNAHIYLSEANLNKKVIVSLTSFPARINEVWQVIECIKRQSVVPDKIILWLSKEQFVNRTLPKSLSTRCDSIFEIRFVEGDIRSHKKYYYAFKEYVDEIVILIDDDLYYPTNMIQQMLDEYIKNPQSVIMRYGDTLKYDDSGELLKYNDWFKELSGPSSSRYLFFGSGGGTLFCPSLINKHVLDIDAALTATPLADDIWLNAFVNISSLSKLKVDYSFPMCISIKENKNLYSENVLNNQNDIQFDKMREYSLKNFGIDPFSKYYIDKTFKL